MADNFKPAASPNMASDPNAPTHNPFVAPSLPGFGGAGSAPQHLPTIPTPNGPLTIVNTTGDPRVIWEDGQNAIIFAKDFPANTGMGRSASRKDPMEALKQPIDPTRVTPVGQGSMMDFVRVWLKDLLSRPAVAGAPKNTAPKGFGGRPAPAPMIASGHGSVPKGTVIPNAHFPNICGVCGGWYYQGTGEHDTPNGLCPAKSKQLKK